MKIIFILVVFIYSTVGAEVKLLLDLPPNEAQQVLSQQDLSLKYAPKIESNVPAVRYIGNHPENVLEDIYLAHQHHGQDGLGGYVYGYSVPDIAKAEKKDAGGDLRGHYSYVDGQGKEIKVEYYDDGTGFHQSDNVNRDPPKYSPDVQAARDEHFRVWNQIAAEHAAAKNGQPEEPYDASQEAKYEGEHSDSNPSYSAGPNPRKYEENQEPVKDPRGFFYSFDYPVGIIVQKNGRAVENPEVHKREIIPTPQQIEDYLRSQAAKQGKPYPVYFQA